MRAREKRNREKNKKFKNSNLTEKIRYTCTKEKPYNTGKATNARTELNLAAKPQEAFEEVSSTRCGKRGECEGVAFIVSNQEIQRGTIAAKQ